MSVITEKQFLYLSIMAKTEQLNREQNIEGIISAPLIALSKANMMMLSGQTRFLLKNCFSLKGDVYEPVMITMSIQLGGTGGKSVNFQIPLLNLLSINALSVSKGNISFSVDITSSESYKSEGMTDILNERVLYRGRLNGTDRSGKSPALKGLEVSVETSTQPLSRGLLTILDIYDKAIRASVPMNDSDDRTQETNH